MRGSEAVVKLLQDIGVEVIFGLCGDTTLPLYDALATGDHGIRHILTRDERSASFMADAYALLSGRVGVCEGPSGGGATYILPGVAEANASSISTPSVRAVFMTRTTEPRPVPTTRTPRRRILPVLCRRATNDSAACPP